MKLYGYWRSSASYRTRIALNLKGLGYDYEPVHLVKDGGQQKQPAYQQLNPAQLVPTLVDGDVVLNQSLAIIEYLNEEYPDPALLPTAAKDKALVRAMAYDVACELQPLTNLRVLQYLTGPLGLAEEQKIAWVKNWFATCFSGLEKRLQKHSGEYCFGDAVTLADVCLVPQMYNAERFQVDLSDYPLIATISQRLKALPAFAEAAPERQPDAQI
ncbi:maleylacetoacetate isomerase [Idiomarina tyrosinivorans]|uniref:Maleylacetoacetate isomerase n=1 Tax=Idiomarina tyrosinivorans TaxID=1445662 RepID=A0A432ZTT6_9GAMM|nr:maleylacetoacetate isomerase [Idiomarina tyrosinivorans]RUO81196.1 maleylacetoacetate isomerase [Idiomarina tyrosinivorans]